jgi:hypothetical protein
MLDVAIVLLCHLGNGPRDTLTRSGDTSMTVRFKSCSRIEYAQMAASAMNRMGIPQPEPPNLST